MSTKKSKRTTTKATSKKPSKAKTARTTRAKKKPEKEILTEVKEPIVEPKESTAALKEELTAKVEREAEPTVEPEHKPIEIAKPEIVEVPQEPETEVRPAPLKPVIVEVEQPREIEPPETVVEVKTEHEPQEVKRKVTHTIVKPLPKPIAKKRLPQPPKDSVLLVIRLRGTFAVPEYIERTLQSLRLRNKYNATLAKSSPSMVGMLRQVKEYVTWGDLKPADLARLLRERGEVSGGNPVTDKIANDLFSKENVDSLAIALASGEIGVQALWEKGVKPVFRLRPPSGGFDSTIKRSYTSNGQLGYRGSSIAILMTKMS